MSNRKNDLERARSLGMSVDEFQQLVGHDPLEKHVNFVSGGYIGPKDTRKADDSEDVKLDDKKKKKAEEDEDLEQAEGAKYSLHDEFTDVTGIGDGTMVPFETDEDVKNKNARELEHHWKSPLETPADEALYYGFHIHGKDNAYGLHAHYPGGPLGGGHTHGSQNRLGYHTHRYSQEELLQFKFARPGVMIQLDGPHVHQHNVPDGKHTHCEENFGPASDKRASKVNERNSQVDKNVVSTHPKDESDEI